MGYDKLSSWLDKVRTGSGSDRVASADATTPVTLVLLEKRTIALRFDPVATAPGSDFVWPLSNPFAFPHNLFCKERLQRAAELELIEKLHGNDLWANPY